MRVLIADDDRVLTHSIAARLNKSGVPTIVAFDAMQAIMTAMRTPLNAVILDVNMPGGTGLEVLRRLKASTKTSHIPILVLSGSPDDEIESIVRALGADAYLSKPASLDVLENCIDGFLGRLMLSARSVDPSGI